MLSGGKDSTALALYLRDRHPERTFEYVFCDTHKELPETFTVAERLARAAEWVMDLDAQYRDLILAGRCPQVSVSAAPGPRVGRVQGETSADYRKLRLGFGELIRPLLLDPPDLKELYPFQRQGAEWLSNQRGAILADDMGLGKTVRVIAAMRLLFNRAVLRSAWLQPGNGSSGDGRPSSASQYSLRRHRSARMPGRR